MVVCLLLGFIEGKTIFGWLDINCLKLQWQQSACEPNKLKSTRILGTFKGIMRSDNRWM